MKKVLFSLLVAVAATLVFSSCGGGAGADSPKDAVNTLTEAMKTGNLEAYLGILCKDGKDGYEELSEKEKASATEYFNKYKNDWAGMETEITDEYIDEKDPVASYKVVCRKDGAEREIKVEVLGKDGKWFVSDVDFKEPKKNVSEEVSNALQEVAEGLEGSQELDEAVQDTEAAAKDAEAAAKAALEELGNKLGQ